LYLREFYIYTNQCKEQQDENLLENPSDGEKQRHSIKFLTFPESPFQHLMVDDTERIGGCDCWVMLAEAMLPVETVNKIKQIS
jgi:hypothetical protein